MTSVHFSICASGYWHTSRLVRHPCAGACVTYVHSTIHPPAKPQSAFKNNTPTVPATGLGGLGYGAVGFRARWVWAKALRAAYTLTYNNHKNAVHTLKPQKPTKKKKKKNTKGPVKPYIILRQNNNCFRCYTSPRSPPYSTALFFRGKLEKMQTLEKTRKHQKKTISRDSSIQGPICKSPGNFFFFFFGGGGGFSCFFAFFSRFLSFLQVFWTLPSRAQSTGVLDF